MILKLAKPDQMPKAKVAVDQWGGRPEKQMLEQARALTQRCGTKASCYVAEMANAANQVQKRQFIAIKAGYMAAVFGNDETRDELVSKLDAFDNAAVRFVAAQSIDHLSPEGSAAVAARMQRVVDRNAARGDPSLASADAPVKQFLYRIRTRAE